MADRDPRAKSIARPLFDKRCFTTLTGQLLWADWSELCHLRDARCVTMFDKHDVVDTLDWEEAADVGVSLDHLGYGTYNYMPVILCSRGIGWAHTAFQARAPWRPFVAELDGYVFTTDEKSRLPVRVWQLPHLPPKAICTNGDKGTVSRLLGVPTLLFDDKERQIHRHNIAHRGNAGFVVKRGNQSREPHIRGYAYRSESWTWPVEAENFGIGKRALPPS